MRERKSELIDLNTLRLEVDFITVKGWTQFILHCYALTRFSKVQGRLRVESRPSLTFMKLSPEGKFMYHTALIDNRYLS